MAVTAKIPGTVTKIIKHTDEICSCEFQPEKRLPKFKPGQFLHLALDAYDPSFEWPESRVFSIASSPTREEKVKITYSIKGRYTKRMYNEIEEGKTVWLKMPFGDFTFLDDEQEIVLIAGGTGITPFIAYFEYCMDKDIQKKITLYYGALNPDLFIYKNEVEECKKKMRQFECIYYAENNAGANHRKGILNIRDIYAEIDTNNARIYLSGPSVMINAFSVFLNSNEVDKSNIIIDAWE